MKTTTFKAMTALAALASAVCTYCTMPGGRALTEQERRTERGRINTPKRTDCTACTPSGSSCNPNVQPAPEFTSPYYTCSGLLGQGIIGADYSATVTVSEECKDIKYKKWSNSWVIVTPYEGTTGTCGSRIISCESSGSTCKQGVE